EVGGAEVHLLEEPEPEDEDGGDLDDRDEEEDDHEAENARARIQEDVGAENRGYRTRGAERGGGRVGSDEDLRSERYEPAGEVEADVARVPHRVLDVGPEDREEEHVAGE